MASNVNKDMLESVGLLTDEIKDANIRVKQGKKILLTQKMNENF